MTKKQIVLRAAFRRVPKNLLIGLTNTRKELTTDCSSVVQVDLSLIYVGMFVEDLATLCYNVNN